MNRGLIACAAVLTLLAQPAIASPHVTRIPVAAGDVSNAKALARLERKVERAARLACGMTPRTNGSGLEDREARLCFEDARARAQSRIAAVLEQRRSGG